VHPNRAHRAPGPYRNTPLVTTTYSSSPAKTPRPQHIPKFEDISRWEASYQEVRFDYLKGKFCSGRNKPAPETGMFLSSEAGQRNLSATPAVGFLCSLSHLHPLTYVPLTGKDAKTTIFINMHIAVLSAAP